MNLRPDLRPDLQQTLTDALKAVANIEKKYNLNQHKKQSVSGALSSSPSKYSATQTEQSSPPNDNDDYECIEDEDTENQATSPPDTHNSNNHLSKIYHPPSPSLTSINNNKNRKKSMLY